jgi:hypothetical protein
MAQGVLSDARAAQDRSSVHAASMNDALQAPYLTEFGAALDRTEALGLRPAATRILVKKDCVAPDRTMSLLLDYFDRHTPAELVGQTVAINTALIPLLFASTQVPFDLTIGWVERQGRACFWHDEELISRLIARKEEAWGRLGLPFHLWLTSPALEILDVTFAMNLGWAKNREECARLIIYQSLKDFPKEPIYHPTLVGDEFFVRIGAIVEFARPR